MKNHETAAHYKHQWSLLKSGTLNLDDRERHLLAFTNKSREFFKGKKVLVAGCNYGWEVLLLHSYGADVTGIDLYVDKAKELLKAHDCPANILQMDIENLCLPFDYFDFIYCNGVLHHTDQTEIALSNLVKVLKPGGEILIGLYGSGGYFWFLTHLSRRIFRLLAMVGIDRTKVTALLDRMKRQGVWSHRFKDDVEKSHLWTIENLYVPIIKNYRPAQVLEMLQKEGLTRIIRLDGYHKKWVPGTQKVPVGFRHRLKYGTSDLTFMGIKPI